MQQLHPSQGSAVRRQRTVHTGRLTLLGGLLAIGSSVACSKDPAVMNPATGTAGTVAPAGAAGMTATAGMPGTSGMGTTSGVAGMSAGTGTATAGRSGGTAAGSGASGTGAAGMASTAGTGAGGGTAADSGGGGAGTGAAASGDCTRELLTMTTDAYYTAMAAHDASKLPLADGAKFTENGEATMPPMGLWATAGMLTYKHTLYDTKSCSSVSESVVPEGTTDLPVGLRLKLTGGKISESELIVVRAGDYTVLGSAFPSNTKAIASSKDTIMWETVVPMGERNTYEEITGWLERYFKTFSRGGCAFADNCQRLENGGGSFACSAALSCDMNASLSGSGVLKPRLLVADTETGIGVGFTMFMGHTDFHMIKMRGGKIYAVHAILSAATSSGWD